MGWLPFSPRLRQRLESRIVVDALWLLFAQGMTALATLIGVRLLTGVMPPAVYGTVNLALGLLIFGRNLFCYPFYQVSLRFYAEVARRGGLTSLRAILVKYLSRSLAILTALIVVIGGPVCVRSGLSLWVIPLMACLLTIDVYRTLETDLLNAARRQRPYAILRAFESWARPLGAVVLTRWFTATPQVVLTGYLIGSTLTYASIFLFRIQRVGLPSSPTAARNEHAEERDGDGDTAELRSQVWRFVLPLVPLAVLEWTSSLSDRYIIGSLHGMTEAGIYAAAYGLVSQPFLMTQLFLEMLLRPIYFEAIAEGDHRRIRRAFLAWVGVNAAVCLVGVLAITFLRHVLVSWCLAPEYRATSADLLPWIALGNALYIMSLVIEKAAHASKRTGQVLTIRLVGAIASVAVTLPMVLWKGLQGAAWSVPIYFGMQLLTSVLVTRRSRTGAGADSSRA